MKLLVLHLDKREDADQYRRVLELFKSDYPYYKVAFIETFSSGLKDACAFVLKDESGTPLVLMPFYLRTIDHEGQRYYDITSTYGYSGPLVNKESEEEVLEYFWNQVDQWHSKHKVVSEFIRFNLSNNHLVYSGHLIPTMNNIEGKLLPPELQWANYDRKVRKNVKRALREEVTVKVYHEEVPVEVVNDFYEIYVETMGRTNASSAFYYPRKNMETFIANCSDSCAVAIAYKDEVAISAELVLIGGEKIFSFLGGTKAAYFPVRPNDILKHEVIKWAYEKGFKSFVLGGGYGSDDGIFAYKKAFFPNDVVMFYTGRKIVDADLYNGLVAQSGKDTSTYEIAEGYFPLYRQGN